MKLWIPLSISFIVFSASIISLSHQWIKAEEEFVRIKSNFVSLQKRKSPTAETVLDDLIETLRDEKTDLYDGRIYSMGAKLYKAIWESIFNLRVVLKYSLINKSIEALDYEKQKEELIKIENDIIDKHINDLKIMQSISSQSVSIRQTPVDIEKNTDYSTEKLPSSTPYISSKIPVINTPNTTVSSTSSTNYTSFVVSICGLIISAFTFASTFFFSYRTDRRNEKESRLKIEQLQKELASRGKLY